MDCSTPKNSASSLPSVRAGPGRREKTFRVFDPDQGLLLPPSLDEWLPSDHLARFVADLVDEHLDLSRIYASYQEGRGAPPYDPRLMVRLLNLRLHDRVAVVPVRPRRPVAL